MSADEQLLELARTQPLGRSITDREVMEALGGLRGWEERYRYIIQLGKQLPALPPAARDDAHRVPGCESQVWMHCLSSPDDERLYVAADSEARVVRGLIAIVLAAVNGQRREAIRAFDMDAYFEGLDLLTHLSPSRGNGLRAIVEAIRRQAGG